MVKVPQEYLCPIGSRIMIDPVMTADGHSYERTKIEEWLQNHDTSHSTGALLEHKSLIPNIHLKQLTQRFIQENSEAFKADLLAMVRTNQPAEVAYLLGLPIAYDLDNLTKVAFQLGFPDILQRLFADPAYETLSEAVLRSEVCNVFCDINRLQFQTILKSLYDVIVRVRETIAANEFEPAKYFGCIDRSKLRTYYSDGTIVGRMTIPMPPTKRAEFVEKFKETKRNLLLWIATIRQFIYSIESTLDSASGSRSVTDSTLNLIRSSQPDIMAFSTMCNYTALDYSIAGIASSDAIDYTIKHLTEIELKAGSYGHDIIHDCRLVKDLLRHIPDHARCDIDALRRQCRKDVPDFPELDLNPKILTTIAHVSAQANKLELLRVLHPMIPQEHLLDAEGNSLVHWAARGNAVDVLRWLIDEQGFQPDLKNKGGKTPQMIAYYFRCDEAEAYLTRLASRPADALVPVDATTQTPDTFFHHSDGPAPAKDGPVSAATKLAS